MSSSHTSHSKLLSKSSFVSGDSPPRFVQNCHHIRPRVEADPRVGAPSRYHQAEKIPKRTKRAGKINESSLASPEDPSGWAPADQHASVSSRLALGAIKFSLLSYNVHALVRIEERLERILDEIGDQSWDVLALSETWRVEREESFELEDGHTWLGSGGTEGQRGVGFLLHRRWKRFLFKPVSERLAVLDLTVAPSKVLRLSTAYMPHAGESDDDDEVLYQQLSDKILEGRRLKYTCICAGDYNAEVGPATDNDDQSIIGHNVSRCRNGRGEMLVQWSHFHELMIANTFP